jgi:cytoskeletal protein CcmA (bactofilin family)
MFFKKKESEFGILETIVGQDSVFHGTIRTKNSIRVDGKIEGGIAEANGVIVGDKGQVQGDINAKVVVIGGKVTGNITATHSLEILPQAQVYGDIHSSLLSIGEGALFEGNCVMATDKNKVIELDMERSPSKR